MLTLTPQARAIATFALGFALVTGLLTRIAVSAAQVVDIVGNPNARTFSVVVALTSGLIGLGLLAVANRTLPRLEPGWPLNLAQVAVLFAVIGTAIAAVDLVTAITGDGFARYR